MNKIWLVEREEPAGYDEFQAHVVVAPTPEEAKSMVPCADECGRLRWSNDLERRVHMGECVWMNAKATEISTNTPKLVLSDFNAG